MKKDARAGNPVQEERTLLDVWVPKAKCVFHLRGSSSPAFYCKLIVTQSLLIIQWSEKTSYSLVK